MARVRDRGEESVRGAVVGGGWHACVAEESMHIAAVGGWSCPGLVGWFFEERGMEEGGHRQRYTKFCNPNTWAPYTLPPFHPRPPPQRSAFVGFGANANLTALSGV